MNLSPHIVLSALVIAGCSDGAVALQTARDAASPFGDGGADAATRGDAGVVACGITQVRPWGVHATGAFVYDGSTDSTVMDLGGPITVIDLAAPSFTFADASGDVTVSMLPLEDGALGVLHVGERVIVHFEQGVVVRNEQNVILAVVQRTGTGGASPTFDVGAVHVTGGDAICTHDELGTGEPANGCVVGTTRARTSFSMGSATASLSPADGAASLSANGIDYRVLVADSTRPATEAEAIAVAPSGASGVCVTSPPAASTVVSVALTAQPDALAACADDGVHIAPTPGYWPAFPSWHVAASGALAYTLTASPDVAMEIGATITAVDGASGSFTLTSPSGAIAVHAAPVDAAWIDALPIGRAVIARFENGVTLRDASDDALLFAVVAGNATIHAPSFDVGPVHVAAAAARCIVLTYNGGGCVFGGTQLDADVSLGSSMQTIHPGDAAATLTDGTSTFEVALVASLRQSDDAEVFAFASEHPCAPALTTATLVAVHRTAP